MKLDNQKILNHCTINLAYMKIFCRTSRFVPDTSRQSSTGSSNTVTLSNFLKWLRNVVLPLPILPSTHTVNGRLYNLLTEPDIFIKASRVALPEQTMNLISLSSIEDMKRICSYGLVRNISQEETVNFKQAR